MPVFVRRLFGIGKLPADVRAEVEAEGVIYLADYVPVTRRFSGAIPGLRSAHSVASYVGSLAFTSQRVLATLSSLARSTEQVLPMLVVTIMVSMVLAGGLIPVTGRLVLDQMAWFVPARWGFAASASTVDLNSVEAGLPVDRLWRHVPSAWLHDAGMLVALAAVLAGLVRFRLRLRAR